MFSGGTRPFLSLERSSPWEKNLEAWKSLGVWDVSGSKGLPVTFCTENGKTIRSREVLFWGLQRCQFSANAMVKKGTSWMCTKILTINQTAYKTWTSLRFGSELIHGGGRAGNQ